MSYFYAIDLGLYDSVIYQFNNDNINDNHQIQDNFYETHLPYYKFYLVQKLYLEMVKGYMVILQKIYVKNILKIQLVV